MDPCRIDNKPVPLKYMPQLDALRAIAVLMVLYQHYVHPTILWGSYGVSMFFVLSGFLITRVILIHKQKVADGISLSLVARNFFVRRALRLMPVYYLTLLIGSVLGFSLVRETLLWHLTYTSNFLFYFNESWMGIVTPYWSLANEEQFYLVWFWIPLFFGRERILFFIALIVIGAVSFRCAVDALGHNNFAKILLPGVIDSFAVGALLCFFDPSSAVRRTWIFRNLFSIGLVFFFSYIWLTKRTAVVPGALQPIILFAIFAMMIYAASEGVRGIWGHLLDQFWLIYIGKISYGIYVVHTFSPAIYGRLPYLWRVGDLGAGERFLAYSAMTIAIAAMSWHFLEKPINRQKWRFSEGVGSISG